VRVVLIGLRGAIAHSIDSIRIQRYDIERRRSGSSSNRYPCVLVGTVVGSGHRCGSSLDYW